MQQQPPEHFTDSQKLIKAMALQARIIQFQTMVIADLHDPLPSPALMFRKVRDNQGKIGKYCRELELLVNHP